MMQHFPAKAMGDSHNSPETVWAVGRLPAQNAAAFLGGSFQTGQRRQPTAQTQALGTMPNLPITEGKEMKMQIKNYFWRDTTNMQQTRRAKKIVK